MDTYPMMLYKAGGFEQIHGGLFATLTVDDVAAHEAAIADGWMLTTTEATEAAAADAEAAKNADQAAIQARVELEAQATELGLKFDGRTSDKKLRDLIAASREE